MTEQRQPWRIPGAGSLEGPLVPEVMLQLYRQNYSGDVRFAITGGEWFVLRFVAGRPLRLMSGSSDRARRDVLGQCLPPEQLAFALRHSEQQGLEPITAALQLALLPSSDEPRLRRAVVLQVGVELTRSQRPLRVECLPSEVASDGTRPGGGTLPAGTGGAVAGSISNAAEASNPPPPGPEYLGFISALLAQVSHLEFYRRRLSSTWRERLVLCGEPDVLRRLEGSLHQLVSALCKGPQSPAGLLARGGASADDLVRDVYVLRSTGLARSEVLVSAPAPRWAKAPGDSGGPGETVPTAVKRPASSISGVRKLNVDDGLPERPSVRSPAQAPSDEHLVEAAALEAWMRAVADPAFQRKALLLTERAAGRFPKNPRILFYLGCAYAQNGRVHEAAGALRRVLDLDPDHLEAGRELAILDKQDAGGGAGRSRFFFGGDPTKKVR